MKVREIMTRPVVTVREETPLGEAAGLMLEHRIGGVPVVGARGEVVGFITESDFAAKEECVPFSLFRAPQLFGRWMGKGDAEKLYAEARSLPAREVMTRGAVTAREDDAVEDVLELMLRHDFNRIPVVDAGGAPVGIVARHDLLKMMRQGTRAGAPPAGPEGGADVARLELTAEEGETLGFVLRSYLGDLRMEIADTDLFEFRERLKRREEILKRILAELDRRAEGGPAR
jgi:CBS domain-containing protein